VRSNRFLGYPGIFRIAQADPALDGLFAAACELIGPDAIRREALTDVTVALTTEAVALADLSSGRFLNYVLDSRNHVITVARHRRKRYRGHHAWELLCRAGHFPAGTPQAMEEAIREPRLTPAQPVARHDITSTGVRQLIADYLTVRCAEIDYSSLRTLASCLAWMFWKQVEALAPEQGDLNLPGELYERWRETVRWREDGKPRKEQDPVLLAVRSFYFDLATWTLQEPAKWAVWVAPCPVPQRKLRGIARRPDDLSSHGIVPSTRRDRGHRPHPELPARQACRGAPGSAARADPPRPTSRRLLERIMTPTPAGPSPTSIRRRAAPTGRSGRLCICWPPPKLRNSHLPRPPTSWCPATDSVYRPAPPRRCRCRSLPSGSLGSC
jgi:hypothetical protein